MMGNILTYIWSKFSSLFSLFTFERGQADEDILNIVKPDIEAIASEERTKVRREVAAHTHEKILSKVHNQLTIFTVLVWGMKLCT